MRDAGVRYHEEANLGVRYHEEAIKKIKIM
jgi:hypothetical protein